MSRFYFFRRFILLPSFVGLACCACQPTSTSTEIIFSKDVKKAESQTNSSAERIDNQAGAEQPVSTAAVADNNNTGTVIAKDAALKADSVNGVAASIQTSLVAYQTGLELASSAHRLSQSAISPDDWGLVASRWDRAADLLKQVTADSEHYQLAQQKIADYRENATQTQVKIKRLQSEVYIPLAPTAALEKPTLRADHNSDLTIDKRRVRVPIVRRLHGTPVVQVTFNGNQTYEMILDTGASRTLVTRQMANNLEIAITDRMIAATASAAKVVFDIGQVRTMTVGSVTLNDAQVSIGDAVGIGLLGNDFLAGYDVIIRSGEGVVELVES